MTQADDLSPGRQSDVAGADNTEDRAWYLYGIIRAPQFSPERAAGVGSKIVPALDSLTVGSMSLGVLSVRDLAAVVRAVPRSDFTEESLQSRLRDPATLEQMVRAHNEVIAAIHERQAILPAKLGGVYASLEDLREALQDGADSLRIQLDRVEGCDEWAVHVYAEREAVERYVASDRPSIRQLREDLTKASPGRAYFLKRKLSNDLAAATDQALSELAQSAYDQLKRFAVEGRASLPSGGAAEREGAIEVLRAAFLVSRVDADAFLSAVNSLYGDREGLHCEYSGPLAPYSFAAEG